MIHHFFDQSLDVTIGHGFVDELFPKRHPNVAERLVAGIQEPKLHFFVGQDVRCHLSADQLPRRSTLDEVVFDYPLFERFRHHRPSIVDFELLFYQGAMLVCGGGSDAIDHAVWKDAVLGQPVPENGISQLGKSRQHLFGDLTVALNVVAGHQSDRRQPANAPAIESLQEISK